MWRAQEAGRNSQLGREAGRLNRAVCGQRAVVGTAGTKRAFSKVVNLFCGEPEMQEAEQSASRFCGNGNAPVDTAAAVSAVSERNIPVIQEEGKYTIPGYEMNET